MNKFLSLKLNQKINDIVLRMSASNMVDLNSIEYIGKSLIVVGESKTGNIIHVRHHDSIDHEPYKRKAGVYVELFKNGFTVESIDLEGLIL